MIQETLPLVRVRIAKSWQPSPDSVQDIINYMHRPHREKLLTIPTQHREVTVEALRRTKQVLLEADGCAPGPAKVTAQYLVDYTGRPLAAQAEKALSEKNFLSFVYYFDTGVGFDQTAGIFITADDYNTPRDVSSLAIQQAETFFGRPMATRSYEDFLRKTHAELTSAQALLREDPDGVLLIEENAKKVKGLPSRVLGGSLPHFSIHELVAAGADLAVDLYKATHPLTKQLFQS